ncbi:hypothetical protein INO02_13525, partial [Staphylococcus aureus]|nr:hypothetical protein [Staphylococcus aureus]
MMPNPGNPNRGGYTNPMEAARLGRLMPPSNSTITEDNDGVFRNKYENPVQGSPPSVMTRL